ncbi:hypothetical protein BGZ61DRAFT_351734 [Ilyonectria robusta]|uniref:uncharacterized protein n=1 Tax=Ilyonectria robusta TaxID=1079257 RepID=UPI001E8CC5C2|nr:uncharacterized protein BGZ61DRAFT_351734 [Ilyonectria robusta]KAH8699633.1 hypothetical protein BGZ61DRAFT_351734 [Ilyonectria robusta]
MASSTELRLVALLRSDHIKNSLLPLLSTEDICAIRQTSSACCNLVTKRLFTRIHISFTASTFTRPARVAALARIGHHIEHLTFYLPHSAATFLPPLIHPLSGNEISFLYTPHTSMGSVLSRPKYANSELGDILTQQYPPMFHAATNVPSFINAMRNLPNIRHLTIRCPGQDPRERYRRNIVDYALISLRISLERAPLNKLHKLSLSSVHPSAFNYLRHVPGFGSVPSAGRRWKQIRKLSISVDAWDFYGSSPGLDHLKIMDDYIRNFAPNLEKFAFNWIGRKGPCPVSLAGDPLFAPPRSTKKLFHEVTSPMSPLPTRPTRGPIHFPKLRYLQIRNSTMNAPQLSQLINSHRGTVKEFDFESVSLANNGNWDDALAPLDSDSLWSRSSSMVTPSECSLVTSPSSEYLPSPSAAVAAASRELMDVDLGGFAFSDSDREIIGSMLGGDDATTVMGPAPTESDVGTSFTTRFRKRSRRRRRKHRNDGDDAPEKSPLSQQHSISDHQSPLSRYKPSRPSYEEEFLRPETPVPNPIVAPILSADPQPILLQPTIYDPATKLATAAARPDNNISPVQRNIEQEETHRLFAEDAAARTSALQKAKAAVLTKLSREFCNNKKTRPVEPNACRFLAGRDLGTAFGPNMVMEDCRGLESRSVLVPLMFSRS